MDEQQSQESNQIVSSATPSVGDQKQKENQWSMILHLSMLTGYMIPYAGLIAPIVIWQIKKDQYPSLDQHGKNATNWIISMIIYSLVCIPLTFIIIGGFLFLVIVGLGVLFPIIAAVKASDGEAWKYPLTIEFFK